MAFKDDLGIFSSGTESFQDDLGILKPVTPEELLYGRAKTPEEVVQPSTQEQTQAPQEVGGSPPVSSTPVESGFDASLGAGVETVPGSTVDKVLAGFGDTALSVVTGVPAFLAGGLAYLTGAQDAALKKLTGQLPESTNIWDEAAKNKEQVQNTLSWTPKTETGKTVLEGVDMIFKGWKLMGKEAGDWLYDTTGSPLLAASAATAIEAVPLLVGEIYRSGRALETTGLASDIANKIVEKGEGKITPEQARDVAYRWVEERMPRDKDGNIVPPSWREIRNARRKFAEGNKPQGPTWSQEEGPTAIAEGQRQIEYKEGEVAEAPAPEVKAEPEVIEPEVVETVEPKSTIDSALEKLEQRKVEARNQLIDLQEKRRGARAAQSIIPVEADQAERDALYEQSLMKGETNAEAVRSNEGGVPERGLEREGIQDQSGQDIQRSTPQEESKVTETQQQAGGAAQSEVVKYNAPNQVQADLMAKHGDVVSVTPGKRGRFVVEYTDGTTLITKTPPTQAKVEVAASQVETAPSDAQKEAGNYQKGHVTIQGLDISIENPKGSVRSGTDSKGKKWESQMANHYGYIKRTEGADKPDQVDVFLGDNPDSQKVYIVDQVNPETGKFDEHKVMIGFESEDAATDGYLDNYETGWNGLGNITEVGIDEFKEWLKSGDTSKEFGSLVQKTDELPEDSFPVTEETQAYTEPDQTGVDALDSDLVEEIEKLDEGRDLMVSEPTDAILAITEEVYATKREALAAHKKLGDAKNDFKVVKTDEGWEIKETIEYKKDWDNLPLDQRLLASPFRMSQEQTDTILAEAQGKKYNPLANPYELMGIVQAMTNKYILSKGEAGDIVRIADAMDNLLSAILENKAVLVRDLGFSGYDEVRDRALAVAEFVGDTLDFMWEDPAQVQKLFDGIFSQIKDTINNEGGSAGILTDLARVIVIEGKRSFESFVERAKQILGEAWDKVKEFAGEAWKFAERMFMDESGKIVFHGTKAMFKKFMDEFIGSGEGAQAFGFGHYVTSKRAIAHTYARDIGNRSVTVTYSLVGAGKALDSVGIHVQSDIARNMSMMNRGFQETLLEFQQHYMDAWNRYERRIEEVKDLKTDAEYTSFGDSKEDLVNLNKRQGYVDKRLGIFQKLVERYDKGEIPTNITSKKNTGSKVVHEVQIPDNDEAWLDLDKVVPEDKLTIIVEGLEKEMDKVEAYREGYKSKLWNAIKELSPSPKNNIPPAELEDIYRKYLNKVGYLSQEDIEGLMKDRDYSWKVDHLRRVAQITQARPLLEDIMTPEQMKILDKSGIKPVHTGKTVQNLLKTMFGAKGTSDFLLSVGIPGNTYIGPSSGERNYVVFDPELMEIQKTYTLDFLGLQSLYEMMTNVAKKVGTWSRTQTTSSRVNRTLADDGQRITVKKRAHKDVMILNQKWAEPNWVLRNHPDAQILAYQGIDAVLLMDRKRELGWQELTRIIKENDIGHSESQRKVTDILKALRDKKHIPSDTPDKILKAAIEVQQMMEGYKIRMRESLREALIEGMSPLERQIFLEVLQGRDPVETVKDYNSRARKTNAANKQAGNPERIKTTTFSAIENYLRDLKEINSWGLDDYVTRAMRGSIRIMDSEGNTVSIAESTMQAFERAQEWLKQHPNVSELVIDDSWFSRDPDAPVYMSARQARYVKGRLASLLKQEANILDRKFREAVAKKVLGRVVSIKPSPVYSPFMQESKMILPGEENIFNILPYYIHVMEKKMALDPYIRSVQRNLSNFNDRPNVKKVLIDQLEQIKGIKHAADRVIDDLFSAVAEKLFDTTGYVPAWMEKDFMFSRVIVRPHLMAQANLKLGYRPVGGLVNFLFGLSHTWIKTSASAMVNARKWMKTPEGEKFIRDNSWWLGTGLAPSEAGMFKSRVPIWKPLGMFQRGEPLVRELALATSYLWAQSGKLGRVYTPTEALEFAKRSVHLQQALYNIATAPVMMRSPMGKVTNQFRKYLVNEIQFINQLRGAGEWAKYMAMLAILGGPRGLLYTLKSLFLLTLILWTIKNITGGPDMDDIMSWMNNNFPKTSRGVFGFFGIDASAPASFQFPTETKEFLGPTFGFYQSFYEQVVKPFSMGAKYWPDNFKDWAGNQFVAGRFWNELWQSLTNTDGWIVDDKGRNMYKIKDQHKITNPYTGREITVSTEQIDLLLGAKPIGLGIQQDELRIVREQEAKSVAQAQSVINHWVKNRENLFRGTLSQKNIDGMAEEMARLGIPANLAYRAIDLSMYPPEVRATMKASIMNREKAAETMMMLEGQSP